MSGQACFSKNSVKQVRFPKKKKKKVKGLLTEGHRLLRTPGTRPGRAPRSADLGPSLAGAGPSLSACPHPCPAPPFSPAATGFYLHCSPKPSSQCAAGPSTRAQQPATSSEAAVHNYNQLLRAVGRPALQTSVLMP